VHFAVSLLSFRPGRVGGAETYLRELLAHMGAAAGPDRLTAVLHPEAAAALATPGLERVVLPLGDARLVAARLVDAATPLRARAVERVLAELRADAVLFPQQSIFPRRAPVRAVLTVHDLLHLAHPEILSPFDRAFRAAIYGRSLRRAARVIAISEFTRRELVARCGVPPERIAVVRQGVRPQPPARPAPWSGADGPYLYYPAASWPHKDHATLFRSFAALRRTGRLADKLVLTGERTAHWAKLGRLVRALGIERAVLHLGFLPAGEVEAVYAGARALVFPSRHEGFGMPVAEAARLGVPFVTSRLPVFDELGVPPARQIDFSDPEALDGALRAGGPAVLARPPGLWTEVARCTLAVMREAAAAPVGDRPRGEPQVGSGVP
jgi:glycosyltransferase involved in cell wall biosynthesis